MKDDHEWLGHIPAGTYHRERLWKYLPHREGYHPSIRIDYALRRYGASYGVRVVEVRCASEPSRWGELLTGQWRSIAEILVDARARGFDLPKEDHAAKIVIGRAIRKLPWTIMRRRDGYTLYSTTAGPYGDPLFPLLGACAASMMSAWATESAPGRGGRKGRTMEPMIAGRGSRHFDGTGERVAMLPRLYDGSRHPRYGGVPERRELSGTCVAIHAARDYSLAHPRTRCTVYVQGTVRTYLRGEVHP